MTKKPLSRREFLKLTGIAAAGGILAACTSPTAAPPPAEPTKAPAGAEPEPTKAPAPAAQAAEISFMGWGAIEEDEAVRSAIDAFKSVEPNIKVNWMHTPDSYNEKLLSLVAAKTPPDTAFVAAGDFRTFSKEGLLVDITDLVKGDPIIGAKDYFIQPQEERRCTWQGKWYGIGSCWVADHLYYNADVFKTAGIEPPSNDPEKAWDWTTFLDVARKLTIDKNGKHPDESGFDRGNIERFGCDVSNYRLHHASFVQSNGGSYFDPETGLLGLDKPEAVSAMQELADLSLKYNVAPFAGTAEQAGMSALGMDASQMLEAGKLAMLVDGSWSVAALHKITPTLGTAVLPKMKTPATGMNAHLHGVLKGTKNTDASFKWVRYLATEFYQLIFLKIGLWLPSQTALMTPDGMKKWYSERKSGTEGIHPPGYDVLITKYVPKYGFPFYEPPGWPDARAILFPEVEAIYNGNKTAEEVMTVVVPKCNDILKKAAL